MPDFAFSNVRSLDPRVIRKDFEQFFIDVEDDDGFPLGGVTYCDLYDALTEFCAEHGENLGLILLDYFFCNERGRLLKKIASQSKE